MRKFTHHLLSLAFSITILMVCIGTVGCLAGNRIASPETNTRIKLDTRVEAQGAGRVETGGVVGRIGGGGDSIALWIAIAALAIGPIQYPIQRTIRVWRENGKSKPKCKTCGKPL